MFTYIINASLKKVFIKNNINKDIFNPRKVRLGIIEEFNYNRYFIINAYYSSLITSSQYNSQKGKQAKIIIEAIILTILTISLLTIINKEGLIIFIISIISISQALLVELSTTINPSLKNTLKNRVRIYRELYIVN